MNTAEPLATAVDTEEALATGKPMAPMLAALYEKWREKAAGRPAPSRADFDIADLRPWLGFLVLVEVVDGGADFFYRVYGTEVTAFYGNDFTGKRLSDVEPAIQELLFPEYRRAAATMKPLYVVRRPRLRREETRVARVVLPLSRDGSTVDQILVGFQAIDLGGG